MKLIHTAQSGCTLVMVEGFKKSEVTNKMVKVKFYQHMHDNNQVGPCYPTKAEALADTNDYVIRGGWVRETL